jgi:signal transduction histidine kinase
MDTVYEALRLAGNVVFVLLAVMALREWRRRPSPTTGWLAASFGVLGALVLVARLIENQEGVVFDWVTKLLIVGIVLFPYFLWRFHLTFRPVSRRVAHLSTALTGLVVVAALALPELPEPGAPRTPAFDAFVAILLFQWTVLLVALATRLWRSGSGQPTLTQRRMRMMATGAVWLAAALLLAGTTPSEADVSGTQIAVQLFAIMSGPFFLLGFAPPTTVRTLWRRSEERRLRMAEVGLMSAETPAEVGAILLPHVSRLLGGGRAELFDPGGKLLATVPGSVSARSAQAAGELEADLSYGRLSVHHSPFAPFFGADENELMRDFALMADLALARADLFVRLRRSNEELEQFAYVASHDLQEPLRTVASYAELLARRYEGKLDEKADRYIDFVVDGCQRMQDLINDLLAFSRVGTKAAPLVPNDLDVPLDRALRGLDATISETGATIERDDLPVAEIDEAQMTLVFQNLIGNAIKFRGDEPPHVEISSAVQDDEIIVTVRDNGIGIEPQYQDRIFTIFQRLHTRAEYPGTGLGLAICKKVVERHGGRIWLDETEGRGSAFSFSLPTARSVDDPGTRDRDPSRGGQRA